MKDERLLSELKHLGDEGLQPKRDLWPGVAARIRPRRRNVWRPVLAAAAVLLALVSWFSLRPPEAVDVPERTVLTAGSPQLQATFASYMADRQALLEAVARELAAYPPETQAEVWKSIEVIEGAMLDLERALGEFPAETEARLAQLYERELKLLGIVSARLSEGARG